MVVLMKSSQYAYILAALYDVCIFIQQEKDMHRGYFIKLCNKIKFL
ncbi:hypothetical protein A311_03795 [Escherichia coli KTE146]|nr:hypothetical protein A311_03795 [Escherichia coli KTE146]